jgi:hypothetical protein
MPWWLPVEQAFPDRSLASVGGTLRAQLRAQDGVLRPGDRVALAVGSRGLTDLRDLVSCTAEWVRAQGAEPFLAPAMGSHGGASAQGQADVLRALGLGEDAVAVPIESSMDTVVLGHLQDGTPVYVDARAAAADHVVPINRVKPHTDFRGRIESGLLKLLAVGLGNHAGATALHRVPLQRFAAAVEAAAELVLQNLSVPFGVAVVEGGHKESAIVEVICGDRISTREPELLDLARAWLPRLPTDQLDVLVVQEIGKDIAGTGMDPNVTGRFYDPSISNGVSVTRLVVLDLSARTHGNACGMGMADLVTRRASEKVDWAATYTNEITANLLQGARLPIVAATDQEAISVAAHTLGQRPVSETRLAWIRNTGAMTRLWCSTPLWESHSGGGTLAAVGEARPLAFRAGTLVEESDR